MIDIVPFLMALAAFFGLVYYLKRCFRPKAKCDRCGQEFAPQGSGDKQTTCPACATAASGVGRIRISAGALLLLLSLGLGLVLGLCGLYLRVGLWFDLIGSLAFAAAVFLIMLSKTHKSVRRSLLRDVWTMPRRVWAWDLAAARRASGARGQTWESAGVTFWIVGPDSARRELEEATSQARVEMERITGVRAELPARLRVFCFEEAGGFRKYTGLGPVEARGGLFISPYLHPSRIAVCGDLARYVGGSAAGTLAMGIAGCLVLQRYQKRPLWLMEGLLNYTSWSASATWRSAAPGQRIRMLRAMMARVEIVPGSEMVDLSLGKLAAAPDQGCPDPLRTLPRIIQEEQFFGYLHTHHPDELRRFMAEPFVGPAMQDAFAPCFGMTPGAAVVDWLNEVVAAELPPLTAPPEQVRSFIDREALPQIADRALPAEQRRMAIMALSSHGYAWGASALVAAMEDVDEAVRGEARRALEDIAGELRGDSPTAWRGWLSSLPAGAAS